MPTPLTSPDILFPWNPLCTGPLTLLSVESISVSQPPQVCAPWGVPVPLFLLSLHTHSELAYPFAWLLHHPWKCTTHIWSHLPPLLGSTSEKNHHLLAPNLGLSPLTSFTCQPRLVTSVSQPPLWHSLIPYSLATHFHELLDASNSPCGICTLLSL